MRQKAPCTSVLLFIYLCNLWIPFFGASTNAFRKVGPGEDG